MLLHGSWWFWMGTEVLGQHQSSAIKPSRSKRFLYRAGARGTDLPWMDRQTEQLTLQSTVRKLFTQWPVDEELGSISIWTLGDPSPQFVKIYHLLEGLLESNQETSYHFISGHPARGLIFSINLVITQEISSAPQARSHLWGWHHLHGLLWPPRPSPFLQV